MNERYRASYDNIRIQIYTVRMPRRRCIVVVGGSATNLNSCTAGACTPKLLVSAHCVCGCATDVTHDICATLLFCAQGRVNCRAKRCSPLSGRASAAAACVNGSLQRRADRQRSRTAAHR